MKNKHDKYDNSPFVINPVRYPRWLQKTRLVDANDQYKEEVSIQEAIALAQNARLDLVCFSKPDRRNLALCKVIDYGKWKYNEEKAKKKIGKDHKKTCKELRFSLEISENDIAHKIKQANEFLDHGMEVIYTMRLRGRERARMRDAQAKMDEIVGMSSEHGKEVNRKTVGANISVRLAKA